MGVSDCTFVSSRGSVLCELVVKGTVEEHVELEEKTGS